MPVARSDSVVNLWLAHLETCFTAAEKSQGQVLLFSSPAKGSLCALTTLWPAPTARFFRVTVEPANSWPYAPFLPLLVEHYAGLRNDKRGAVEADLKQVGCYHRHREPLAALLCGERRDTRVTEDFIAEEVPFERQRLETTLLDLLVLVCHGKTAVLVCEGGENLPDETALLLRQTEVFARRKLLVLVGFSGASVGRHDTLVGERQIQGQLFTLPGREGVLPPACPPCPDPQHTFLQLLAFRSGLNWLRRFGHGPEDSLREVQCLAALQEYEQALFVLQPLMVSSSARQTLGRALPEEAAWVHLGLDDHLLARSLALQALKLPAADDAGQARTDFLLYHVPGLFAEFPELAQECRERMARLFGVLGWANHLVYLQGRNVDVMQTFWKEGPEAALNRAHKALSAARRLGNVRREGVVYHSLAHVLQAKGDLLLASNTYRKALRFVTSHSRPYEVARLQNGVGYFQMTLGLYRKAFDCHRTALTLLQQSRFHDETVNTQVNLARLLLLTGSPDSARDLLESVLLVMDQLQLVELPFQRRSTIQALLGLTCFKTGQLLRAREILGAIDATARAEDPSPHGQVYIEWLRLLVTNMGEERCRALLATSKQELRYLALQIELDLATEALHRGESEVAERLLVAAEGFCLPSPANRWEVHRIAVLRSGNASRQVLRLPRQESNLPALAAVATRDAQWRTVQKSLRTSQFLQEWQDLLNRERRPEPLLTGCRELVLAHFLVDFADFSLAEPEPPLTDLLEQLGHESCWLSGEALVGTPWLSASWLLVTSLDGIRHRGFVGSQAGPAYFEAEDHRALLLAFQHLATSLSALRQSALLAQSEKMSALGSLVAGIAHEINTPVGISVTGISFLNQRTQETKTALQSAVLSRQGMDDYLETARESGDLILRNLLRAGTLIDSFKRVASDQSSEERRSFALKEYLEEVLLSLSPKWKKTAIGVVLTGAGSQMLDSYPGALAQVVTNLVVNALTHAFEPGDSGQISVKVLATSSGHREFFVEDNGCGVAPRNLPHLFEPFFTTRRNQGGTGLGLHISYNLVQNVLGGTIVCESTEGKGTRFVVRLPENAPRNDG